MSIQPVNKEFERHTSVNDVSSIRRCADHELWSNVNFDYIPVAEDKVHLEQRTGTSKATMTEGLISGTGIMGICFAEHNSGIKTLFSHDGRLYHLAAPPTELGSGYTDAMWDFVMMNDLIIGANGTDVLKTINFSGTVANLGGTPPVVKYLAEFHNMLFGAGVSGSENVLYWTAVKDPTDWTGNSQTQPFVITGIGSLQDNCYVFGRRTIRKVTGYADNALTFGDFSNNIGCISHYSIVSNGTSLFFAGADGFYALGSLGATDASVGGIDLIKLSEERVDTYWEALDTDTIGLIHGGHDPENHRILWTVRRDGQSVNDRIVFFDYHRNILGFGFQEGRSASCFATSKDSTGKPQVLYGDSNPGAVGATSGTSGLIYKFDPDVKTDDGTAVSATLETKAYDFGRPDLDKKWNYIEFLAKGEGSEVEPTISYGVGEFPGYQNSKTFKTSALPVWGTAKWGVDPWTKDTFRNYSLAIRKLGKSLVIKIESSTSNKRIRLSGWRINAQAFRQRQKTDG